jgi:hypothetical protein
MEHADALLTIAEIALGLAGFGGLFLAIGRDRAAARNPADTYRLGLLLTTALATLLLALLPVGFQAVGLAEDAVWSLSSAIMAVSLVCLVVVTRLARRRHLEEIRAGEQRTVAALLWLLALATTAAQLANALGLVRARAGVFLFGLIFLVAFGSYLFARMLFLWRG